MTKLQMRRAMLLTAPLLALVVAPGTGICQVAPTVPGAAVASPALPAPTLRITSQTAASVLAHFKAVTGGAAWDSVRAMHTISSLSTSGLNGTDEEWDDVLTGRTATHISLGPVTQASGYDGKSAWEQENTNAAHLVDSVQDRQEANNAAYLVSCAFWYPKRHAGTIAYTGQQTDASVLYDVLTVTPAGGHALQLWFDRSTGLLNRMVNHAAEQTQTTYVSDYRPVVGAGVLEPFTSRQTTGIAKYDSTEHVTSYVANAPVPAGEFQIPAPPAADFSFAGGASSVTVPFHYWNEHIFLPIQIDGKEYQAIFDTGGAYVIDTSIAKALNLKPQGAMQATGNGTASIDMGDVRVDTVQIAGLTVQRPMFMSMPLPAAIQATPIVGAELAQRFITTIDYDHDTITFTLPSAFHAPAGGIVVPFQFNGDMPEVKGSVDGVPGVFTIDTGAGGSLDLNGPFVTAHHLTAKYKPKFTVIFGYGIGGPDKASMARVKTLTLGGAVVHNRVAGLRGGATGAGSNTVVAGNIGNGVLHQFNLILNYGKQTITFIPNHHYGELDQYTRSGIVISAQSEKALVSDVIPGSPAAKAGIKPGDVLQTIDGHPLTGEASDETFRASFGAKPAGTRVVVTLLPGGTGAPRTVTLTLRNLI